MITCPPSSSSTAFLTPAPRAQPTVLARYHNCGLTPLGNWRAPNYGLTHRAGRRASQLKPALNGKGPLTVMAPGNGAFEKAFKEFGVKSCRECRFSNGGQDFAAVNGNIITVFSTYTCEKVTDLRGHNSKHFHRRGIQSTRLTVVPSLAVAIRTFVA